MQQWSPSAEQPDVPYNENLITLSALALYGRDPTTSTGLTWGYYGSDQGGGVTILWGGFDITAGTLTLTASSNNYIVVASATGVISVSTATTNWNDSTNYQRVYEVTTDTSKPIDIKDNRAGPGGVFSGGSAGGGGSGTVTSVGITAPAAGITVAGSPVTTSGAITLALANDLAAVEGLSTTGIVRRTATNTWSAGTAVNLATEVTGVLPVANFTTGTPTGSKFVRDDGVLALPSASFTGGTLSSALNNAPPVTIASGATMNIGAAASNTINVPGTSTITSFDTIAAGAQRILVFGGVASWTYNATSMILPGGISISTAAGDAALVESLGSGNWRCLAYCRANGTALVSSGTLVNWTEAANSSTPNATTPVVSFTALNAATNVDIAFKPKGTGSILASVPDNTSAGGNKRGTSAVDLQTVRSSATQIASGGNSTLSGGQNNTASGTSSVVSGGSTNTASNTGAAVIGGNNNVASSSYSGSGGQDNTASADFSFAYGKGCIASGEGSRAWGKFSTTRGMYGADAWSSNERSAPGDRQTRRGALYIRTTNATPAALSSDNSAAGSANQFNLISNSIMGLRVLLVARNSSTGDAAAWLLSGVAKNVSGTVSLVGTATSTLVATDTSLATASATLIADNTNKCFSVQVTGIAATTIDWVGEVVSAEAA